ncbi:hypothetical protein KY339_04990 [Candidatus Woesearchaeota archaeon]|nr:hypothetical protein [Candidatus Woesearchaeota archaeon]
MGVGEGKSESVDELVIELEKQPESRSNYPLYGGIAGGLTFDEFLVLSAEKLSNIGIDMEFCSDFVDNAPYAAAFGVITYGILRKIQNRKADSAKKEFLEKILAEEKKPKGLSKAWKWFWDRPSIGASLYASVMAYAQVKHSGSLGKWLEDISQNPVEHTILFTWMMIGFFGVYGFLLHLKPFISSLSSAKSSFNQLLGAISFSQKRYDKAIERCEKCDMLFDKHSNIAEVYLAKGQYDLAVDHFGKFIEQGLKEQKIRENFLFIGQYVIKDYSREVKKLNKKIKKGKANISDYVKLALKHFSHANIPESIRVWDEAIEKYPSSEKEVRILYGLSLKRIGLEEKAKEQFGIVIKKILEEDKEEIFELQGESRNEVFRYKPKSEDNPQGSTLLSNTFVFKRGNEANLEDELENYNYFKPEFQDDLYEIIEKVKIEGKTYLISRYAGKTLFDVLGKLSEEEKAGLFEQCIDSLYRLHKKGEQGYKSGKLRLEDVVEQDSNYFTNRIRDVFFGQAQSIINVNEQTKNAFLELYSAINDVLSAAPRTFYSDSNPKNRLLGKTIDLESKKLLPQQIDLVKLLEYQEYFTQQQTNRLIEKCINKTEQDRSDFFMFYQFAAVQTHLEMIGYSSRDFSKSANQEYLKDAKYHLEKAKQYLKNIYMHNYLAKYTIIELRELLGKISIQAPQELS